MYQGDNAILPAECSIPDAFRLAGKREQHPKLIVILAGLNDLVSVYKENHRQVPRTADGQLVLMDFVKRFLSKGFCFRIISSPQLVLLKNICPFVGRPNCLSCCSFITSIGKIRADYGEPYPYVFWVGFGRTKCVSFSLDLLRWMEKIDTLLTKAVRRKSWPAWLHYTPLVVMNCSPKVSSEMSIMFVVHG